ncbi:MAG: VOC family protein [Myxococcota bacterium]
MTQSMLQPYLAVSDAAAAIEVYTRVFGAREVYRLPMGDKLGHAELDIGSARLLLSDEFPQIGVVGPLRQEGHSVSLLLYVDDVDATVARALEAGFTQEGETKDEFFGDRAAKLQDPFGHRWMVHQKVETLSPEEIVGRFDEMMKG